MDCETLINMDIIINGVRYSGQGSTKKTILENIEDMGLTIHNSCRRGLCGSCQVSIKTGKLHPDKKVVENNKIYSCTSFLISDAVILVSY
jgi:ferredoxin